MEEIEMIVNIDKLKMAQQEIINAGIKGESAIAKLKAIEISMKKLAQKEEEENKKLDTDKKE